MWETFINGGKKTRPGAEFFLGNKKIKGSSRTTGELYYLSSMCIFMGSRKCGKLQHSRSESDRKRKSACEDTFSEAGSL